MTDEYERPQTRPTLTLFDYAELETRIGRAVFSAGLKLTTVWFVLCAVGMVLLAALSGRT